MCTKQLVPCDHDSPESNQLKQDIRAALGDPDVLVQVGYDPANDTDDTAGWFAAAADRRVDDQPAASAALRALLARIQSQ